MNTNRNAQDMSQELPTREEALVKYARLDKAAIATCVELKQFLALDPHGNALRSHACGRDPMSTTTIEYFYHLRLLHSGVHPYVIFPPKDQHTFAKEFCDRLSTGVFILIDHINDIELVSPNLTHYMFEWKKGSGKIADRTVKALHGLCKQACSHYDMKPSTLEQRVSTLKLAVYKAKLRNSRLLRVNEEDAIWAYRVIHNCHPRDAKLLRDWTLNFGNALKKGLESEYLDVQFGFTPKDKGLQSCPREFHPTVSTYKPASPIDGDDFCLWHATNCFSPSFNTMVFEQLNEVPFFDSRPADDMYPRYGRAVSFGEKPIAMEVKGRFHPPAPKATSCEEQMMNIATKLAEIQNKFVRDLVGADVPITIHCNLLHILAGSIRGTKYGQHSDASDMTTSKEGRPIWMNAENSRRLPTKSELQTISFYWSLVEDGCSIWWAHLQDLKKKVQFVNQTTLKKVSNLKLGKCGLHWQGPMSQECYQHQIDALEKNDRAGRVICSCRFSIDGGHNPELYARTLTQTMKRIPSPEEQQKMYNHFNVLNKVIEGGCVPSEASKDFNTDPMPTDLPLDGLADPKTTDLPLNGPVADVPTDSSVGARRSSRNSCPQYTSTRSCASAATTKKRKAPPTTTDPPSDTCNDPILESTDRVSRPTAKSSTELSHTKHQRTGSARDKTDWQIKAHTDYSLKRKWKDTFPFLSHEEYEKLNLRRTGKTIELGSTVEKLLLRPDLVKKLLLEKGVVAWTPRYHKHNGKVKKMIPTLFMNRVNGQLRLFQIGQKYSASKIALMAGSNHCNRQRDLYQPGEQECLHLTTPYKNDLESVLQAQEAKDPTFIAGEDGLPSIDAPAQFGVDEVLFPFGSGGSAMMDGMYGPDIRKKTKDASHIVIPPGQNIYDGGINEALYALCLRKGVVAVFSEYENFNPGYAPAKKKSNNVQFDGYYRFYDRSYVPDTKEEQEKLEASLVGAPENVIRWSMFRTRPYLKYILIRLFSPTEWGALRLREERHSANHQIYRHIAVNDTLETDFSRVMKIPISESFQWKEEETGEKEVIEYCFSRDALDKFIQDEEPENKVPTAKPSGVGLTADGEDEPPTDPVPPKLTKGTSGSIIQCLVSVLLTTQAAFRRFLGKSLTSDSILNAAAAPLDDPALPLVNRMHAFPSGNRAMDLGNIFHRSEWELYRKKKNLTIPVCGTRIEYDVQDLQHREDVNNLMFRAILLRVAGRVQRYSVYQRFMKEVRGFEVAQLPELDDKQIDYFTSFVKAEIGEKEKSMSSWISDQHKGQIPKALREDVDVFVNFVTKLSSRIVRTMDDLTGSERQRDLSRNAVVKGLVDTLLECVEANAKDVAFIAQAAMLDVEEFYSGLFPAPSLEDAKTIVGGPGSEYGFGVVKNSETASTLEMVLVRMLAEMNLQSSEFLACFGAKRNPDETFARWSINGRPLNVYDMEHFLCKVNLFNWAQPPPSVQKINSQCTFACPFSIHQIYIIVAHTFGNHCFSRKPEAAKPHCWPLRIPDPLHGQSPILQIVMDAVSSFAHLDGAGSLDIPEFHFLSGESSERTLVLSEVLHTALFTSVCSSVRPKNAPSDSSLHDPDSICDSASETTLHDPDPTSDFISLPKLLKDPPPITGNFATKNLWLFLRTFARQKYPELSSFPHADRIPFQSNMIPAVSDLLSRAIVLEVSGSCELHTDICRTPHLASGSLSYLPPLTRNPGDLTFYPPLHSTLIRKLHDYLGADGNFNQFLSRITTKASDLFETELNIGEEGQLVCNRSQARKLLSEFIRDCAGAPEEYKDACELVAFKAMFSIEEIFVGVFQTSAAEDMRVIEIDPDCRPCLELIYNSGFTKHPAKAIATTLKKLNHQSQHFYACIGAKKDNGDARARWTINSRPFDISDVHSIFLMVRPCRKLSP